MLYATLFQMFDYMLLFSQYVFYFELLKTGVTEKLKVF